MSTLVLLPSVHMERAQLGAMGRCLHSVKAPSRIKDKGLPQPSQLLCDHVAYLSLSIPVSHRPANSCSNWSLSSRSSLSAASMSIILLPDHTHNKASPSHRRGTGLRGPLPSSFSLSRNFSPDPLLIHLHQHRPSHNSCVSLWFVYESESSLPSETGSQRESRLSLCFPDLPWNLGLGSP